MKREKPMKQLRASRNGAAPRRGAADGPRGGRGQALLMALAILVFVLPLGITLSKYVQQTMKSAMAERRQKNASQTANNAMTDYMRQFSQDANNGHYDLDALSRPETFYDAGYSTVTFEADEAARSLYVSARGVAGSSEKGIEALVRFVSDLTQYGNMFNGAASLGYSNIVYSGGFYVNGNFSTSGTNMTFTGPLIVKGNLTAATGKPVSVTGDLYYTGTKSGVWNVGGTTYKYAPSVTWPTLDFNYYEAHYTFKSTRTVEIIFYTTGTFRVVGGASYAIPANGAIIYAYNANLKLRGAVSGRVTAVAVSTAASNCTSTTAQTGRVIFNGSLYYASGSSISASSSNSFAALAKNCIEWNALSCSPNNIVTVGVHFVEQGLNNMKDTSCPTGYQWIYGVRTQVITGSGYMGGTSIIYDPNLVTYPPPGLPEKAQLVNYRML